MKLSLSLLLWDTRFFATLSTDVKNQISGKSLRKNKKLKQSIFFVVRRRNIYLPPHLTTWQEVANFDYFNFTAEKKKQE